MVPSRPFHGRGGGCAFFGVTAAVAQSVKTTTAQADLPISDRDGCNLEETTGRAWWTKITTGRSSSSMATSKVGLQS